jgi:hypothetical protein
MTTVTNIINRGIGNTNAESRIVGDMDTITVRSQRIKKITDVQYNRLKKYSWGIGIEHEVQLFHMPVDKNITNNHTNKYTNKQFEHIIYDSLRTTTELVNNYSKYSEHVPITLRDFLDNIPFEPTGRKCHGEYVIQKTPVAMPEFITDNPFSILEKKNRTIESYCQRIKEYENKFILAQMHEKTSLNQQYNYGTLKPYPFGMCNYIKVPTEQSRKTARYTFKPKLYEDYVGSYHVTLTLPFDTTIINNKVYNKKFIATHQNFANQFQWLEPLLISAYFSCDQKALGTIEKRIRGSFRIMRVGWGNPAGSDVRHLSKGIGRYADIDINWRKNLSFKNTNKLKKCDTVTVPEPSAISAMGANFRTFGSTDPERPWHRESGIGMTIPNGVEIRIFDHFPSEYLNSLCTLIVYIAENSRVVKTNNYVYDNDAWNNSMKNIMEHGWAAQLDNAYIEELRNNLKLKIKTNTRRAFDVLQVIATELSKTHKKGDYPYLLLEKQTRNKPLIIPNINKDSWNYGLLVKLNREPVQYKLFMKMLNELQKYKRITKQQFGVLVLKYFDTRLWKNNINDIFYCLISFNVITLKNIVNPTNIAQFYDLYTLMLITYWKEDTQYNKDINKDNKDMAIKAAKAAKLSI